MADIKITPGQLVEPKAGRDAGRYYLVLQVINDKYVLTVDGEVRRLENPKKKNVKHLILYNRFAKEIAEKLAAGERMRDTDIRQAIESLLK